ncbi:MAG: ATPase [Clostridia bacterium]|nr:ATPase [Clostridia bacterium]
MEIFTLLETLEDILEKSKSVPFTDKSLVSKNEILDIIKEIRLKLPDELKQAKWIKEERERIIKEAQKDADDIVKEAENRIISMIDEHEITKQANERKNEIITTANDMYREYENNAKSYADEILQDVENKMIKLVDALNSVEINLQGRIDTLQEERKQLK